ncbi:hypothetical protein [Natronomonas sp.]|uniref:hypothetical protein n=1 Tax=Natronomonas sp. TaxID=2184060 RepID=UPI003975883A
MAHELESGPDEDRAATKQPVADNESPDDGRRTGPDRTVGRRGYLRWGAAAAAIASFGVGGASAELTRDGITFARVVDAVEELKADPTGSRPVNRRLASLPSNSLIRFPEGEYRIDGEVQLDNLDNIGFESPGDAMFVGTEPKSGLNIRSAKKVYYEGFTHADTEGSIRHRMDGTETVRIRDISGGREAAGFASADDRDNLLEIAATDAVSSYEVTVSGEIGPVDDGRTPPDLSVSGRCAEGTIAFDTHALRYTGAITAVSATGDAAVRLNGEPMAVNRGSGAVDPRLTRLARIEGVHGREAAQYEFTAFGDVFPDTDRTGPHYGGQGLSTGNAATKTVTGGVENGVDAYHFSRGINLLEVDGPARVSIGSDR